MELIKKLIREEEGQGMVEYALIVALISVVTIGILGTLGGDIIAKLTAASAALK